MATTTKVINLAQLDHELGDRGLNGSKLDGTWTIESAHGDITEAELVAAIAAHTAAPDPEPTIEDKLASVGLSLSDLKAALGI